MPERGFATTFWTDPFVQGLSQEGKLLFIYLWTNPHCNQAGLYEITPRTIAFDTGIEEANLLELLPKLSPKIIWYPEHNLVWVKNFVRRQTKSPKFLVAVAKSLNDIHIPDLIDEFIEYNKQYSILIPYPYNTATVPIPSSANASASASASAGSVPISKASSLSNRGRGIVKGEGEITTDEMQEIATLYEEEIDKIVPVVAHELNDALREYPTEWIKEAIGEAACNNVRKWKYVVAILKRWKEEGRGGKGNKLDHMVLR